MEAATQTDWRTVNVILGEFKVCDDPVKVMTTVLGSCVATCLYDPVASIGGMNHFLLPAGHSSQSKEQIYGLHSMELLINGLLKKGCLKSRMQAKVFGGAQLTSGLTDAGEKNAEFIREFLKNEGIPCVAESLGGDRARRLKFWPTTGKVRQMLLSKPESIPVMAEPVAPVVEAEPEGDGLELF